ncbi:hypothetical protein GPECTOR_6g603 [Gonium pectorale]|uniref:Uncharacterized protein n=1 Tax=Gonium pectorale TaxID=33097 RepID=A0A150GUY5_GONPE|nr:hypothetical protein GPECTOR_6g603 [Gonium pectorale]|eukprot:KXZ53686.1 hypothetical protein GPECTOR_6g603 [Gonium pectorale]
MFASESPLPARPAPPRPQGTATVVLGSLAAYYCPVVGGRHWFTGPRPNLGQFDDDTPLELLRQRQRERAAAEEVRLAAAMAAGEEEAREAARAERQGLLAQSRTQSQRFLRQVLQHGGEADEGRQGGGGGGGGGGEGGGGSDPRVGRAARSSPSGHRPWRQRHSPAEAADPRDEVGV